jgi:NAD(P)-dependent dehydrogenase (short-subunit alcohol dehydrogenase family)
MSSSKRLQGKIALVTGGTSGLGLATARHFIVEGAQVFITGRRQDALDTAVQQIGGNVAGVQGDVANLADLDRLYDVIREKAAAKLLPDGGRIVTIGSGVGTRVGFPGAADYAGTKAAVVGYSKGAARDLAPRNITVNVVQAGLMDTDMAAEADVAEMLFSTLAIQRFGRLEEIAAGVVS